MRKLRLLSMAVVLALTLAATGFAGITNTPPEPQPVSEPVTATGITECPPSAQPTDDNNPVIDLMLAVLLTLF